MPDPSSLKVGDRIRILRVPKFDLDQREREIREDVKDAGWTANTIERIIQLNPVVTIDEIDEDDLPWFEYEFKGDDGEIESHRIAIMEDDSWEHG
jgi:hypothetical protein